MEQKIGFLHCFCEKAIKYIALVLLVFVTILAIAFQSSISLDVFELSTININGIKFYAVFILSLAALVCLVRLLSRISEQYLFWGFTIIYFVIGTFMIANMEVTSRYDPTICYINAWYYSQGEFMNLGFGDYFYKNPHQLGIVTYNWLWMLFSKEIDIIFVTNLVWIIVTNFVIWQTMKLLYPEKEIVRKIAILLLFGFLPHFLYLFYAYGQVPGLGGLALTLYFTVRYMKKKNWVSLLLSFAALGFACMVRQNYVIAGIAVVLIYFMKVVEKKQLKYVAAIVGVLCSILLPGKLVNAFYEHVGETDLSNGMPAVLYAAMGLQEPMENYRAAGWYNAYNDLTYMENHCDTTLCTQIALDSIKSRLDTFVRNPTYAVGFFGEKLITTWCEPTFQCIWSGPNIPLDSRTEIPILHDLYSGGISFQLLSSVMNIISVWIYLFTAMFIIWKIAVNKETLNAVELFSMLFFVGGFLFHLVWETKSQYVYPYVVMLIPLAANGIWLYYSFVKSKIAKMISGKNSMLYKR